MKITNEDKEQFKKRYKKLLIDCNTSEKKLAEMLGATQNSLNQKTRNATIKYIELEKILDFLGYEMVWIKKDSQ